MLCHSALGLISLIAHAGKPAQVAAEAQELEVVRIKLPHLIKY